MSIPTPQSEINLIETFADTQVIGVTINHENMTDVDVMDAISQYEQDLRIPVTDALTRSPTHLVQMVVAAFPNLQAKTPTAA